MPSTLVTDPQRKHHKKEKKAVKVIPKKISNRPKYGQESSASSSSEHDDDEEEGNREEDDRTASVNLQKLQAHLHSQFGSTPLPAAPAMMVWDRLAQEEDDDMLDDFEARTGDEDSEEEEDEDGEEEAEGTGRQPVASTSRPPAQVSIFKDPSLSTASTLPSIFSFQEPSSNATLGTNRDMKKFMSSKVRNSMPTFSVADAINAKGKGRQRKMVESNEDSLQESHLSSLDDHLSTLLRPLIAPSTSSTHSQLPLLLSSLPAPSQPIKKLKGLTPLPVNTPRTLRRGQSAANLKRARGRDEAAGIAPDAKRSGSGSGGISGREALTLKEKRAEENGGREEKRARGMKGGAVGKMRNGGLVLSREEVDFGNRVIPKGVKRGRGGTRSGGGGKRGGGGRGGRK